MSQFFFDSSALVKRYLSEIGSAWVTALTDRASEHIILVAEITRVEVAAAFAARQRAPDGRTPGERDQLYRLLAQHCATEYEAIPISVGVADAAMRLTQVYRLRGYDAIQLAAALDTQVTILAADLPGLTFVAADTDLLAAARAEGLTTDNPNLHP
jgi:predicted nucleic acid-binding protein